MVFEKTVTDVVKGIRASKRDTALYISSCIAEIKSEINSTDPHTKANALQKLTFLQMMGYNMSWASFATIEVMSSPRFAHKRIGYLAATQAFTQDTDVILLTTNTLKKELRGAVGPYMTGVYEAGLAINCLSNIVTEDLARELLGDITNLTVHPEPYLRKKAILCLLKMFMKYPQALRLTFPRIQECLLKDKNSSVTSCAVNVITELSDVNPKNYLVLAPSFFALLTSSSNNWMLIKVVKLLGTLVPEEPRLARKLLEPLAQIVKTTQAKSLLFEAVYTITLCLPYCQKADGSMPANVPSIVALSAETLKSYIEEPDQNLKYLGLVGFGSLMMSHPKVLSAPGYRPLILACLSDEDVTIRTRALDLLGGLATRKNVMDLITQLLHHVDMASGEYKIDLVHKIIDICSSEKYSLLSDFAWYIDVLVILARTKGIDGHGKTGRNLGPLISSQIIDVALRVVPVRPYAVRRMIGLMLDGTKLNERGFFSGTFGVETDISIMPEVLPVAAFILGEYSSLIDDAVSMKVGDDDDDEDELVKYNSASKGTYHAVIQALTDPSNVDSVLLTTQSIYAQATMKIFAAATCSKKCVDAEIEAAAKTLSSNLPVYMQSMDAEVQERAVTAVQLLKTLGLIERSSTPDLQQTDDENEENSDEEPTASKDNLISNMSGDLLNIGLGEDIPIGSASVKVSIPLVGSTSKPGSIASKARNASATLKYLFIPEHMKPVSNKAQRKKISSTPDYVTAVLANENKSVFAKMFDEEKIRQGSSPLTVEAVSFTQQRPVKVTPSVASLSHTGVLSTSNNDAFLLGPKNTSKAIPGGDSAGISTSLNSNKQHDPFYLNSNDNNESARTDLPSRFGTIQLGDSDGEDSNNVKKKKRKKKTKKATKMGASDLEFLAGMVATEASSGNRIATSEHGIINSDDEDDVPVLAASRNNRKQAPGSKKNVLAAIDLTMPLREDEFIPEPKHRVVPERVQDPPPTEADDSNRGKKKKKEKKSKSSKKSKPMSAPTQNLGTTSDLLDFGGFDSSNNIDDSTTRDPPQANAINSAFDDLLSLDVPASAPVPALPTAMPILHEAQSAQKQKGKKSKGFNIWQQATIKGFSSTLFDWEDITVVYRVHSSKKNGVKVSLKVKNTSNSTTYQSLNISLPGVDALVFNTLGPQDEMDLGKVGPFQMASTGIEIKGNISIQGQNADMKIQIPSSLLMMKPLNIKQEAVTEMLGSGEWASYTSKIEIHQQDADEFKIKTGLSQFLSAMELGDVNNSDKNNYLLASKSNSGAPIIMLVKRSKKGLKIDVKSPDKKLAKAVSSDLKKIDL